MQPKIRSRPVSRRTNRTVMNKFESKFQSKFQQTDRLEEQSTELKRRFNLILYRMRFN